MLIEQSRIFVDTSVLFAAALSAKGYARDLLLAGIDGQWQIFISRYVLVEAKRNLILKHAESLPLVEEFEALLTNYADPESEQLDLVTSFSALKDPDDIPILAAALKAKAEYLAT